MNCFVFVVTIISLSSCSAQEIFETVSAVVGHSAELPCNVTAELEDDKLNIQAWYKNGSATAFYSRDLRGGEEEVPEVEGRYRVVTGGDGLDRLVIVAVVPSDAGVYHCLADFAASPAHNTFVQLDVIEPPRNLWVIQENGTQVAKTSAGVNVSQNIGPYYVGDTVHLFCVALGGKPQASLSWRMEQRVLKDTYTPLSEVRVRSDLAYGPLRSEDHGRVLSCQARNNRRTAPLAIDVVIDMLLPPELVSLRVEGHEGGRVKSGETLELECRVLGARPPPPVVWRLGDNQLVNLDQNVTVEASQRLLVSRIQLSIGREYDEAALSCCVPAYSRGDDTFLCSEKLSITVLYAPVLEIVVEEDLDDNNTLVVSKGSDVRMACTFQANPAVDEMIWFHENDTLSEKRDGGKHVQAILELAAVDEANAGEYVCYAANEEGATFSEPVRVQVTYPAYCEDDAVAEYGVGPGESVNLTCRVRASPAPALYRWQLVDAPINESGLPAHAHTTLETDSDVLLYQRPNTTTSSTIFCWGINEVKAKGLAHTPCTFLVTDETAPRPLSDCSAVRNNDDEIFVKCKKGHDGGLPQKFKFIVQAVEGDDVYLAITVMEPEVMISEPKQENYKFVITAFNDKGESKPLEIAKDDIEAATVTGAVSNITTLALALCGGVLLVALAACGLVLCAHEEPRAPRPAYNTEESNCETYGSEDESECIVRRTESFRRAVARYPSRQLDVRRSSSFHSARQLDAEPPHDEPTRDHCRVHSLQNISRRRDADDHLVLHVPADSGYNVPRPMNTFYTMPRKNRQKCREMSDEVSEITQSDGFSLPPPPDEFGTYRAATRIKDIPRATPTYSTVKRNTAGKEQARQHYTNMAPMNTVGIPTVSGTHNSLYAYSDDDHHQAHHQDIQVSDLSRYLTRESGF